MDLENLKMKLFKFGFYGTKLKNLTNFEIEIAKNSCAIEIVTNKEIENLKKDFHMSLLVNVEDDDIKDDDNDLIVRLNSVLWRNIGTNFEAKFNSEKNITLLNYMVEHMGVSVLKTKIKEKLDVENADIFYFIKKLKIPGIISESKDKLSIIYDLSLGVVKSKEEEDDLIVSIFGEPLLDRSSLKICRNISLLESYKEFIDQSPEGVTSSELAKMFGDTVKGAGNLIKKLLKYYPDEYVQIMEINYKYRTGRVFLKKYFEKFNLLKNEKIKSIIKPAKKDLSDESVNFKVNNLTNHDRKMLINTMLEKYGAFPFEKAYLMEIKEAISYDYFFCKRSFMKIAEEMDINIFTKCGKVILAKKEISEDYPEVISLFLTENSNPAVLSKFQKRLRDYILYKQTFVLYDNGYEGITVIQCLNFCNFLKQFGNKFEFTIDKIYELTLREYLQFIPVGVLHFKERIAILLYMSSNIIMRRIMKDKISKGLYIINEELIGDSLYGKLGQIENVKIILNDLFNNNIELTYFCDIIVKGDYKPVIKVLSVLIEDLKLREFYGLVELKDLDVFKLTLRKFKEILKKCEKFEFISIEDNKTSVDNIYTIRMIDCDSKKIFNLNKEDDDQGERFSKNNYLTFSGRDKFIKEVIEIPESNFLVLSEKFIMDNYPKRINKLLCEMVEKFWYKYNNKPYQKHQNISDDIKKEDLVTDDVTKHIYKMFMYCIYNKIKFNIDDIKKSLEESDVIIPEIFRSGKEFEGFFNKKVLQVIGLLKSKKILGRTFDYINFTNLPVHHNFREWVVKGNLLSFINNNNDVIFNFLLVPTFPGDKVYYQIFYNFIYNIIKQGGSIDLEEIVSRCKYLQEFEVIEFLEIFNNVFEKKSFKNFFLYQIKDIK